VTHPIFCTSNIWCITEKNIIILDTVYGLGFLSTKLFNSMPSFSKLMSEKLKIVHNVKNDSDIYRKDYLNAKGRGWILGNQEII